MDNGWIHERRGNLDPHNRAMRAKVTITIVLVFLSVIGVAILGNTSSTATQYRTDGIVIDFGNYNTVWTEVDFHEEDDTLSLLTIACDEDHNDYALTVDSNGNVTKINDIENNTLSSWGLWYVEHGNLEYVKSDSSSIDASQYEIVIWAYCASNEEPTVAVDATGVSIYGYSQANRVVTLSPVATEIVGAMNAVSTLVGTDSYSDYPSLVETGHNNGTIAIVGTYTDPSYESILSASPNLVICEGSLYNHISVAEKMRNSNTASLALYNGDSVKSILDNIFITGTAMGYELRAQEVIDQINVAMMQIESTISGYNSEDVMIALSDSPSPYVSGSQTYIDDILSIINCGNSFGDLNGWTHINSEYILQKNPSKIIIINSDSSFTTDEESYQTLLEGLSEEWKSTDAYKNGEIYVLCESLGEMASRSGPRCAQLTELFAMILDPDAFTTELPKYIGNDYVDYLSITKNLGYGD